MIYVIALILVCVIAAIIWAFFAGRGSGEDASDAKNIKGKEKSRDDATKDYLSTRSRMRAAWLRGWLRHGKGGDDSTTSG